MVVNGSFLEGHRTGFNNGVDAGWTAGYLRALQDVGVTSAGCVPEPTGVEYVPPVRADLNERLEDLHKDGKLSVRAFNCLNREEVYTIGDLVNLTELHLWDMRNLGAKSIDEIKALLAGMGLALKDSSGEGPADL